MPRTPEPTAVLTIRVPASLERRLARAARARRRTRSATARDLLEAALAQEPIVDPAAEAQRQSRLASAHESDADALAFIAAAADVRDWR